MHYAVVLGVSLVSCKSPSPNQHKTNCEVAEATIFHTLAPPEGGLGGNSFPIGGWLPTAAAGRLQTESGTSVIQHVLLSSSSSTSPPPPPPSPALPRALVPSPVLRGGQCLLILLVLLFPNGGGRECYLATVGDLVILHRTRSASASLPASFTPAPQAPSLRLHVVLSARPFPVTFLRVLPPAFAPSP